MSFEVMLTTYGVTKLTAFKSKRDFHEWFDLVYAERWLFFKQIIELVETRENLLRWGDFDGYEEQLTDWFIKEAEYWRDVYFCKLDWREEDFDKFESERLPKPTQKFSYGKITNGDSGIHWKSVGEVFNWTCHICGEKVDRIGGTPTNRRGCTVEHIVPQSKGGANTWNNVRPAHWDCNLKKNANI